MTSQPMRIGLFGGTFDPVHLGHLAIARDALESLELDEVRFLPCRQSPHKQALAAATAAERVEMLQLATAGLPWAVVDPWELHAPAPSFSVTTAAAFANRFPDARLFWLLGGDQWEALPSWHDPQRLAELVEFAVFPRGPAPQPRAGFRMHVLGGSHPASATAIRADPEGAPSAWLPPEVAAFIRRNRLYSKA